jgi:excisionase family DNA binding protein
MSTTEQSEQSIFLTVRELATYLRVSRTKAYQLVASGEVPTVRVGGQFRIPRALLAKRLAETLRQAHE